MSISLGVLGALYTSQATLKNCTGSLECMKSSQMGCTSFLMCVLEISCFALPLGSMTTVVARELQVVLGGSFLRCRMHLHVTD